VKIPAEARQAQDAAGGCIDARRFVEAIPHAERAAALCPDWPAPWRNLSIGYKHARRWEDTLRACERAIVLDPDKAEGPHWNAGIAATALGRWDRARAAWAAVGITLPAGSGPIEMALGLTPIRLSPGEAAEVAWCDRIDPCRARVRSVPLPDSRRRYDDLILHDGEPRGSRMLGERSLSVLDELAVLEPSAFGTWEVELDCPDRGALLALLDELEQAGLTVEDWTESVRMLCAACSLGEPHRHAEEAPADDAWQPARRLGVAARSERDLHPLRRAGLWWRRGVRTVRQVL
jgi:hypothetical protein